MSEDERAESGPGKYDDVATLARVATNARAMILMVIDGDRRGMADQIEAMQRARGVS